MAQDGGASVKAELLGDQLNRQVIHQTSVGFHQCLVIAVVCRVNAVTHLFHVFTRDRLTTAVHRSFCDDDDVQTGATPPLLKETKKKML